MKAGALSDLRVVELGNGAKPRQLADIISNTSHTGQQSEVPPSLKLLWTSRRGYGVRLFSPIIDQVDA